MSEVSVPMNWIPVFVPKDAYPRVFRQLWKNSDYFNTMSLSDEARAFVEGRKWRMGLNVQHGAWVHFIYPQDAVEFKLRFL